MSHRIPAIYLLFALSLAIPHAASAAAPAKSETFRTSDNVTLHYLDAGPSNAPAIVFIPGWTMAADIFEPQINALSSRFHVIALDPRSQGDSEKTPEGNYPERHARDINELLQHLKLSGVVLLGWSNGVPDVLAFIEQNGTTSLQGIVLVDGFLKFDDPGLQKGLFGMLQSLQADRAKFTDGFVRSMYASKQSDAYIQHVEQTSMKTPTNTAVVEMFNVLSHGDFTPLLAKIDKPVLYICQPRLASQANLLQTALPTARVEVFKDAAHALFVDDPDHFNKVLAGFMDSLATPNR